MSNSSEKFTSLLAIAGVLIHLAYAPYTKVEESFNIQATHDVLSSGISLSNSSEFLKANYDHVGFPGSVPRTFVGAVTLALLVDIQRLAGLPSSGLDLQTLVRGVLGLANATALISFRNAVSHSFGKTAGMWYMILQTSQFHVMYYASRTLPNMFAFTLTTIALRNFVYALSADSAKAKAWYRECLFLLTFAGVVFRAEIAVLVFSMSAFLAGINTSSIRSVIIPAGLIGAAVGLLTTVTVDSYFWQRFPMWPELEGFYYNTILGKSSDWGVSPPGYYFTNALPKLLLNPLTYLLLIPTAVLNTATRSRTLTLILPSLTFIAVYSLLPHKEWRFIIYTLPALTAAAATGASWIWTRRSKSILYRLLAAALLLSTLASFTASAALLAISSLNYPGGAAVARLHALTADAAGPIHVHADNLACQTGLTRFLEDGANTTVTGGGPRYVFDKTDDATALVDPAFWVRFEYALVESPERAIGKWEVVDVVRAYAGVRVVRPGAMLDDRPLEERIINGRVVPLERWEEWWMGFGDRWGRGLTGGWWVVVRMEGRLRVLRRQRTGVYTGVEKV